MDIHVRRRLGRM